MRKHPCAILALTLALQAPSLFADEPLRFDFCTGKVQPGFQRVLPTTVFDAKIGYGFEPGAAIVSDDGSDFCESEKPFFLDRKSVV